MQIRRYQGTDRKEVWTLHNLVLEGVGAHAGIGPWDDDLNHIKEAYLDNGGEFVVGLSEGRIVAMGGLMRSSKERAEIRRMRVHPDFQRRGFGRAILQRLESAASKLGYETLHLDTTVKQIAAQNLYVQSGYIEVSRTTLGGFDVILYEKNLVSDDTP